MKDRYNREIDYLRISVTDKCNYNCRYCKPNNDENYISNLLTDDEIVKIVNEASELGVKKVRLTGGEPLLRKGINDLIAKIKENKHIEELVMTTNASVLYEQVSELKKAGLDRVNISIDSLDFDKFNFITNVGNLNDVLKSIDKLLELDMKPVKINVVLMKGFNNNEINDFINLTINKDIIVRFIELMPIGNHNFSFNKYYLSNQEVLNYCPELIPVKEIDNETAVYFKLPNAKGKVGLISAVSQHFCGNCNRIRVTSDGKVKACLHENKEYDLLTYMRKENGNIKDYLKQCIIDKPESHKINKNDFEKVKRSMYRIGG